MQKIALSIIAVIFSITGMISSSYAQKTDFQSWTQVTATVNLDPAKQWFAYGEVQPRIGDDISRLERLLVRPALGYNLNQSVAFYLGYAWTPTFMNASYDEDFRNENRIWQQVLIKHTWLGLDGNTACDRSNASSTTQAEHRTAPGTSCVVVMPSQSTKLLD